MKKLYKSPLLREINLETEGVVAASETNANLSVNRNGGDAITDKGNLLSNERDMWGNEDIWK